MAKREDEQRLTCRLYLNEEKGRKTLAMIDELLSTGKFSNRNDLLVEGVQALYDKVTGQIQGVRQYMDEAKRLRILADELGPIITKEMEMQMTQHDTKLLAILVQGNGRVIQPQSNQMIGDENVEGTLPETGEEVGGDAANYMNQMFGQQV